jgi:hypothetical protein
VSSPAETELFVFLLAVKIIQKCLADYNQSLEIGIKKWVVKTAIGLITQLAFLKSSIK